MKRTLGRFLIAGGALAALLLLGMPGSAPAGPQAAGEKPVKATGDIKPPKIIKMVQPVYPEDARKQGIEGVVILEATADANGKVQEAKVLRGVAGLDQAAIDAVKQWVYEPTVIDGKPRPVVFTVTVRFALDKGKKDAKAGVEGGVKGGVEGGVAGGVEGGVKGGVEGAVVGGVVGGTAGAVKAEGDIKPPKLIKMVDPVYPEEARKQGLEGLVILEATADVEGKVKELKILRGVEGLNQAALDAVKQWVYEPLIIEGKPRPVIFTVTVNFKLKTK